MSKKKMQIGFWCRNFKETSFGRPKHKYGDTIIALTEIG
jgi:hypothetical protein